MIRRRLLTSLLLIPATVFIALGQALVWQQPSGDIGVAAGDGKGNIYYSTRFNTQDSVVKISSGGVRLWAAGLDTLQQVVSIFPWSGGVYVTTDGNNVYGFDNAGAMQFYTGLPAALAVGVDKWGNLITATNVMRSMDNPFFEVVTPTGDVADVDVPYHQEDDVIAADLGWGPYVLSNGTVCIIQQYSTQSTNKDGTEIKIHNHVEDLQFVLKKGGAVKKLSKKAVLKELVQYEKHPASGDELFEETTGDFTYLNLSPGSDRPFGGLVLDNYDISQMGDNIVLARQVSTHYSKTTPKTQTDKYVTEGRILTIMPGGKGKLCTVKGKGTTTTKEPGSSFSSDEEGNFISLITPNTPGGIALTYNIAYWEGDNFNSNEFSGRLNFANQKITPITGVDEWIPQEFYHPSNRIFVPNPGDYSIVVLDSVRTSLDTLEFDDEVSFVPPAANQEAAALYGYFSTFDGYMFSKYDLTAALGKAGKGRTVAGAEIPEDFRLDQNYPNPFNPTTTLSIALPADANVTLKVYNIAGQEIRTLYDRTEIAAGTHIVSFDGGSLASGVYFYRMEAVGIADPARKFSAMKKMVLLR